MSDSQTESAPAAPRPKSRRRRGLTLLIAAGIAVVLGVGATGAIVLTRDNRPVRPAEQHEPRFSAGAVLPTSADAALPPNALYVAADAAPGGNGSIGAPYATVKSALDRIKGSGTIVLRGGEYHESVFVGASKQVELRSYPGEQVVFDGSAPLTGWIADAGRWSVPWSYDFDASPSYDRGAEDGTERTWQFLREEYPMAAHPEQVWLDGERLAQVETPKQVTAGSFAVLDGRLVIGTDPEGREVRASVLQVGIHVRSPGSTLSGFTVRRFAPSIPDMGSVVLEGDGDRVVDLVIEESSTTGLFATGTGVTLERVTIRNSGMIGMTANFADHLTLSGVHLTGNNIEHFNQAPVAGGFKISRSQHLTIRDSVIDDNDGPGIWIDQSVLDTVVASTDVLDNAGHGVFAEISHRVMLVDLVIAGNLRMGVKINDTGEVTLWRNTIIGNGLGVAMLQDTRRGDDPEVPGHDERQPFPDPEMPWVIGSVLIGGNVIGDSLGSARDGADGGDGYLWLEDYSKEFSADDMGVLVTGNLFYRLVDDYPPHAVVWQLQPGSTTSYATFADFQRAVPDSVPNHELSRRAIESGYVLSAEAAEAAELLLVTPPDAVVALLGDDAVGVGARPAQPAG